MERFSVATLEDFIVAAKSATYVGDGAAAPASRPHSHDLAFTSGDFSYLDSYFGGSDFVGEEVVYHRDEPVWAMNYYGRIILPKLIDAVGAGAIIKAALSAMYRGGRFLGGYRWVDGDDVYLDRNEGDVASFTGRECITRRGTEVYELVYHGGLIKA